MNHFNDWHYKNELAMRTASRYYLSSKDVPPEVPGQEPGRPGEKKGIYANTV
jgi:hypothetical protein